MTQFALGYYKNITTTTIPQPRDKVILVMQKTEKSLQDSEDTEIQTGGKLNCFCDRFMLNEEM